MVNRGKIIVLKNLLRDANLSGHRQSADLNPASTRKFALVLGTALLSVMLSLGQARATTTNLINVQFLGSGQPPGGPGTTYFGPAVLGSGIWNQETIPYHIPGSGTTIKAAALVNSTYMASDRTLTVGAFPNEVYGTHNNGTATDVSTTNLMSADIEQFITTGPNIDPWTFTVGGLSGDAGATFNLVIYAAAPSPRIQTLSVTGGAWGGNTASNLTTTSTSRKLSAGSGVAYNVFTGTLTGDNLVFTVNGGAAGMDTAAAFVNGFQLQIITPDPVIKIQPGAKMVLAGQTASFTVTPAGTAPFHYQWQAGPVNSGSFTNLVDGGNIAGATGKTLTIANVTSNQALDYVVIVKNDLGAVTSAPARLTADSATRLVNVAIGGGARQTGAAVLGAAGDFWNQAVTANTFPIVDTGSNTLGGVGLALANAGQLYVSPAGPPMDPNTTNLMQGYAYGYTGGTANVTVSLNNLTEYINSPFALVVHAVGNASGQGAMLHLTGATGGNSTKTLTTSASSRQISAGCGVAYQIFMGALTNGTLTLTATENAGQQFTALNGFQLLLAPAIPPIITTQPVSQTNDNVSFSVETVSVKPVSYQWQAGAVGSGTFTNLLDGGQVLGATDNILKLSNTDSNWALAYRVVATNDGGSVTSSVATLNVLPGSLIPIMNANFDLDALSGPAAPTNQTVTPTGWTGTGTVGLLNPDFFYLSPTPGVSPPNTLFTFSPDGVANPSVSQMLTTTLNSNTTYTLSVQVGNRSRGTWGGYHIALETTNGTVVGDWVGENNNLAAPGTFATSARSFTTGPNPPGLGQPLEIVLEQAVPTKNSYSDFDSVSLTAAPAPPHTQGTPIDVYVCAGQSNAHGWQANPASLSLTNLHYVNTPDARALFAYQANLITQKNFYSQGSVGQLSTEGAGYAGNFSGFGPELSAGSDLAVRFGKPLALVKFASGGADLHTQFLKSANLLYPRLISEVTNSLQQLIDHGYAPTVKGFFWLQGESDAMVNPSTYAADIAQFISDVRTDLNARTLQFILTEINSNLPAFALSQGGVAQVNQAMVNLQKTDPNVTFVTTADITNGFADTIHYSADQIITIGQRWASAFTYINQPAIMHSLMTRLPASKVSGH
jgi:hypothetical protein